MAKNDGAVAEFTPDNPIQDFINGLPPIQDDPASHWGEETESHDVRDGDDDGEVTMEVADEESGDTERERDESGRFKAKDSEEKPADSATVTPDSVTTEEPAAKDYATSFLESASDDERQAYEFSRLLQTSEDPIALIAQQAVDAGLTAQLLEKLGIPQDVIDSLQDTAAKAGIDPDYEPTGYESVLRPHIDKLAKFDESVSAIALPVAQKAVNEQIARMVPYLDASNVEAQLAVHQMGAIAKAMGLELPSIDRAAIATAMGKDPALTYADAVKQAIGDKFDTVVADYRQANKERPSTPASDSDTITLDDLPRDRAEYGVSKASDIYKVAFGRK